MATFNYFYIMANIGAYQVIGSMLEKYMDFRQAKSMQEYMNDYNSPIQQVARLRQAGISPWQLTGEGNTSAQPVMSQNSLSSSLGSVADREIAKRQTDAQVKLADAQVKQTESQTKTIDTLLKYLDESEQVRIENQRQDTSNKLTEQAETAKRVSRYDQQVDSELELKKAQQTYYYAQTYNCRASTNRINRLLSWEIKEAKSRINMNNEQVAVLKSQANLNDKQCANLGVLMNKSKVEIKKLGVETWALQHSNEIWQKCGVKPGTPAWTAVIDVLGSVITEYVP